MIYVAQPIKKKDASSVEEAKKIREKLQNNQNTDNIKENLKRTVRAVEKLKEIKKDVREKVEKECRTSEKVLSVKQSALKVLDELEAQIN